MRLFLILENRRGHCLSVCVCASVCNWLWSMCTYPTRKSVTKFVWIYLPMSIYHESTFGLWTIGHTFRGIHCTGQCLWTKKNSSVNIIASILTLWILLRQWWISVYASNLFSIACVEYFAQQHKFRSVPSVVNET